MIAITAPTGHVGSALVRRLLGAGRSDLRLLLRDASKLDADVRDAVALREGNLQDSDYVRTATEGADALFWLTPHDLTAPDLFGFYESVGRTVAGAVRANGIGRVVHLSAQGAQNRTDHGGVSGLGRIEDALDAVAAETGVAVRHLRPAFFQENFEQQIEAIRQAGAVFFPAPPERGNAMIATRDVAAVAADLLADESWTGVEVVPLHGPLDLSYAQAADVLSDVLGRPVEARQVPKAVPRQQLVDMGASESFAEGSATVFEKIGTPGFSDAPRTAESTMPTEFSTYVADTLRPIVESAGSPTG